MTTKEILQVLQGDVIEQLRMLPDESVHCCVTSPPYWGLRDYSTDGQIGLEKTSEQYVAKMVEVFLEVRRVLRRDGTLWLNLGDSYASSCENVGIGGSEKQRSNVGANNRKRPGLGGLKQKDLCGIPWRVAFALQADGWWLRSDIIWAKPNPMPESMTDRPTKAHEYLFLLTKSANYFYDAEAIKEQSIHAGKVVTNDNGKNAQMGQYGQTRGGFLKPEGVLVEANRNKRSVWTVATAPYPEAHFATYPPDLIKPCILAGTSAKGCCAKCGSPWERITERGETTMRTPNDGKGYVAAISQERPGLGAAILPNAHTEIKTVGWEPSCRCRLPYTVWGGGPQSTEPCTVLDPFAGSGTTGAVALELGRKAILIELNPKYVPLIRQRCDITLGLQLA